MAKSSEIARRWHCPAIGLACLAALLGGGAAAPDTAAAAAPVTITNYTDPSAAIKWGNRSDWKQPWRSYLDTVPATTLLDAVGINFNVAPKLAAPTARLLATSGFRRARIEVGWGTLDYTDPSRIGEVDRLNLVATLTALREHGIRPLILLNANHGKPCPLVHTTVTLTAPAQTGDTEIHLDPTAAAEIVPGRTGITGEGVAAQTLFASVAPDGTVGLSRPLPVDLPAGPVDVVTLRYEPFGSVELPGGEPNPRFGQAIAGWLNYVKVITNEVERVLGSEEFDVEIWNELSFGSRFLDINDYYEPDLEPGRPENVREILDRTVAFLRDPANGVPGIGIGNGFSNQSPWWNGATSPVGLTAIDKHPYAGWQSFPADAAVNGNRPLNGLGELAGRRDELGQYHAMFTPTYEAFFPEYFLSAIQTETLVHDLSPYPSTIGGVDHGRHTYPVGGSPPQMWVTEVNLAPGSGPVPKTEMSAADIRHVESKIILRYLVAYVNKGVSAIHFYAARAGHLSLVDAAFFSKLESSRSRSYPGDAFGGETTDAVRRLTEAMAGATPISSPRNLTLRALTDYGSRVQFSGDGSAAHPPLFDRDVFAFLPFQVDAGRFVVPVYVMTRNVVEDHRPGATEDPTRFDLPAERYRMTIGGVDGSAAMVSATDPLSGETVPVEKIAGNGRGLVVEMPVTDSPRLLTIQEYPALQPPVGGSPPVAGGERRSATPSAKRGSTRRAGRRCQARRDRRPRGQRRGQRPSGSVAAAPRGRSPWSVGGRAGRCGHRSR